MFHIILKSYKTKSDYDNQYSKKYGSFDTKDR